MGSRTASLALAAALCLVAAASARADGDPASDELVVRNVFYPVPRPSPAATRALEGPVRGVYARHERIKVAVIASETDLGAVPGLWAKPTQYAAFLGQELRLYYIGPLLIVMPAGYGIYDGGRSVAAEERVLATLPKPRESADDLTRAAATAVSRMSAAHALRSKDILAPIVYPVASAVTRGKLSPLRYSAYDDSGRSREVLTLVGPKKRIVGTVRVPLRSVRLDRTYSLSWHAPKRLAKTLSLCAVGFDAAGNKSRSSCERLVVN